MRQLPIMGGWYFCAFAGSTYDGAEISTQKGHKSDALALLATMVLVLRSSQPVSYTDAQSYATIEMCRENDALLELNARTRKLFSAISIAAFD